MFKISNKPIPEFVIAEVTIIKDFSKLISKIDNIDENKIKALIQDTNTVSFNTSVSQAKTGENVLGYIPGVTDEIIVISAHYDHIGYDRGEICNGADDDGSGTSSLLSISKAFQKAFEEGNKPQRGILF